jgi:protoporphyrinogen oxidase
VLASRLPAREDAAMPPAPVAAPLDHADLLVLGAGPAGLGAALLAARRGAHVIVVDQGSQVGGLCVTRRRGALRYDVGGHIPFVDDADRYTWLVGLLGDDLVWVPRPVSSWRDGAIRPGRFLDQRPAGIPRGAPPVDAPEPGLRESARDALAARFGAQFVDAELRPYLEKIDGVPLERIPGVRPLRLMREQAAPEGFWFPRRGIGQLMDVMAHAITDLGGQLLTETTVVALEAPDDRVGAVVLRHGGGVSRVAMRQVVVSAPPGAVARRLVPAPPPDAIPPLRMRAICIVYFEVARPDVTGEAWIQIDDPRVPAARIFEMPNWSRAMCPEDRSVLGMECYCSPTADDPIWGCSDTDLAGRCAAALVDPLGWVADAGRLRLVEVVRLPAGYPAPDLAQLDAINAAPRLLEGVEGLWLAQGSAVVDAIRAGEDCAAAALAAAR